MLRLITFGGLALTKDGAPYAGIASQRRRLALLAVLATAGSVGVSRDKLLAYFWPDAGEEQARHALNQALHQMRVALGSSAITSTTTALALDSTVVTSDISEFERASAERSYEHAATLYHGPFLDGFHIRDAPEFERWVTATRARLRQTWASVVEALAVAASGRRDRAAVVRWRLQLAAADPLNVQATVALAEAHVAAGDRAGALRAMTAHEMLVRTELEAEPDAQVKEWIGRLKSAPRQAHPVVESAPNRVREVGPRRDRVAIERAMEGRYTLGDVLARGSVVTSFNAIATSDGTPATVHVASARVAMHADPERFVRTLSRVGALGDPRILPVVDVGATDECLWFATPVLPHPTLREQLALERQLAIPDAVRLARDLAAALAVAHANGLTHGDLRPKRIAILGEGVVISDWALIDALAPARDADVGRTETAVTIVAPAYASPEQLEGHVMPDARSDIYSAGCVVFEALAGAAPFASGHPHALITHKLTRGAPSVIESRDQVPPALDAVLGICLARSPADRYQSGAALAAALETVI